MIEKFVQMSEKDYDLIIDLLKRVNDKILNPRMACDKILKILISEEEIID